MSPLASVGLFVASALVGYFLIRAVPAMLHTPLMSGMNALSGITVLGALAALGTQPGTLGVVLCSAAIALAMVNIAGGFKVTDKILAMFSRKEDDRHE